MSRYERYYDDLATYNSEVARGIVHTPEWKARMAAKQAGFDNDMRREAEAHGHVIIGGPTDRTSDDR